MPRTTVRRISCSVIAAGLTILAIPLAAAVPAGAAPVAPPPPAVRGATPRPAFAFTPGPAPVPARAATTANYPPAYDTRSQYLTNSPTPSMPNAYTQRSIYLAAGAYVWDYYWDGQTVGLCPYSFTIHQAGWYNWYDYLITENGYYDQGTYMGAADGSGQLYTPSCNVDIYLRNSTTYTWGSRLTPQF